MRAFSEILPGHKKETEIVVVANFSPFFRSKGSL